MDEIHPLIIAMDSTRANMKVVEKAHFVKQLRTFRPQQTVFEVRWLLLVHIVFVVPSALSLRVIFTDESQRLHKE
jgi:hypothetical protein